MLHEDVGLSLPDLEAGNLGAEERAGIERHLAECSECGELRAALRSITAALQQLSSSSHPSSSEIVAFSTNRAALEPDVDARVAGHLPDCSSCNDEVARTREAHVDLTSKTIARTAGIGRFGWRWAGALGGVVLASLLVVDLTLRLAGPDSTWSGPVSFTVLSDTVRGVTTPTRLSRESTQPFVPFAVEVDSTAFSQGEGSVRFDVIDASGSTVWATELSFALVIRQVQAAGVVTFLLPSALLVDGEYTLSTSVGGETLQRFPFTLRTDP